MRDKLPTRAEILEKYRSVIDSEDFQVLAADSFPQPEAMHQEGASMQYLGTLNDACLWAKRQFGRVVAIIVLFGGLIQGLEYINKYSRLVYEQVVAVFQAGQEHRDVPATHYQIVERPNDWALPADQPFTLGDLGSTTTTTTTTTTPGPDDERGLEVLPPGSGLIPYSDKWGRIA